MLKSIDPLLYLRDNIQQNKFNPQQPLLDIKYISYANSCSTPIFIDSYLQGSFLENLNNQFLQQFRILYHQ